MDKQTVVDKNKFKLRYGSEILKVETADYIQFSVLFSDGKKKLLVFDIDTSMDLRWNFVNEVSTALANDIGKLIEEACFP